MKSFNQSRIRLKLYQLFYYCEMILISLIRLLLDQHASPLGRLSLKKLPADFLFWFMLHISSILWKDLLELQKQAKVRDNVILLPLPQGPPTFMQNWKSSILAKCIFIAIIIQSKVSYLPVEAIRAKTNSFSLWTGSHKVTPQHHDLAFIQKETHCFFICQQKHRRYLRC